MSTGPVLPEEERRAIQAELKRIRAVDGLSQGAIAQRLGLTQGAVSKAERYFEMGQDFAASFYRHFGDATRSPAENAKLLIWKHGTGAPAPHSDMPVVEFMQFVAKTPSLKELAADAEITVLDLLRIRRTPPRHGYAGPKELRRHIEQLRHGDVGEIPGTDVPASAAEDAIRAASRPANKRTSR